MKQIIIIETDLSARRLGHQEIEQELQEILKSWPRVISRKKQSLISTYSCEVQKMEQLNRQEIAECKLTDITIGNEILPTTLERLKETGDLSPAMQNTLYLSNRLLEVWNQQLKSQINLHNLKIKSEVLLVQQQLKQQCEADSTGKALEVKWKQIEQQQKVRLASNHVKILFSKTYRKIISGK